MKEYLSIDEAIKSVCGESTTVDRMQSVSGGDINDAYTCILSNGLRLFLKSNQKENLDFFYKEAEGLSAIKQTRTIRTPDVLALGTDGDRAFLLLSHIDSVMPAQKYHENFGENLAAFHAAYAEKFVISGKYGFIHDNYIGAGYQANEPRGSWIEFFRDCRLKPQFKRAEKYFDFSMKKKADILMEKLDRYLVEPEKPSLLHGDLWSGNYITGSDGEAWLIDPAVYVGHSEADIAMTELFGGFSNRFYASYRSVRPLAPGYEDRKEIYNLYHLLNHLNLFGGSYLYSVKRVLERYG